MDSHILSVVAVTPVAGVLALLVASLAWPGRDRLLRAIALVTTAVSLAASSRLWLGFQARGEQWQFTERFDVLPEIGASYAVGIDGLSLLLILLTTFLSFTAVLASWATVTARARAYYISVLLLETGMLGVYMALDLVLLCLCWTVAAASMCMLIGSAEGRARAALRVTFFAIVPGILLLAGVFALHVEGRSITGAESFDIRMFQQLSLPVTLQRWVFLAFLGGIGIGLLGVFRCWLVAAAHGRAVAVPVLLAAVFLKMGTYGFLRLSLPLLPDASRTFAQTVMALAALGIVGGAMAAIAQTSWTRVLAFASLSHVCLVTLGAFALTPDSLTGSALHQINHGVSIAALFLVAGFVVNRGVSGAKPGNVAPDEAAAIDEYGGLLNAMPAAAAISLLMTLSLVGVPKLNGFVGARLIFEGLWPVNKVWSVVALSGMALSGVVLLWLFARTMLGELKSPSGVAIEDLRPRDVLVFVPLVLFAVWVGVSPAPLLARIETSVARVVIRVSPEYSAQVADCLTQPPPPPSPAESGLPTGMILAAPCADEAASTTPKR